LFTAQISFLASATLGTTPAVRGILFFGFAFELPAFLVLTPVLLHLPDYSEDRRLVLVVHAMGFLVGLGIVDVAAVIATEACRSALF
jgi:hypothetical protein